MKNIKLKLFALSFLFGVVCVNAEGANKKKGSNVWNKSIDQEVASCRELSAKRQVPELDIHKGCDIAVATWLQNATRIAAQCETSYDGDFDVFGECFDHQARDFITDDLVNDINLIQSEKRKYSKDMLIEQEVVFQAAFLMFKNLAKLKLSDFIPAELGKLGISDPDFTGILAIYCPHATQEFVQSLTTAETELLDKYNFIKIDDFHEFIENSEDLSKKIGIFGGPVLLILKHGEVVYVILGDDDDGFGDAERLKTIIEEQLG